MSRLPLILLLAFPAFALAGGEGRLYRFDRSGGQLTVAVPWADYAYDTHDGAAFGVSGQIINLRFLRLAHRIGLDQLHPPAVAQRRLPHGWRAEPRVAGAVPGLRYAGG